MKKIQFVDSLEGLDIDALILQDEERISQCDHALDGALAFNRKRYATPFWVTTNGKHAVPKIAIVSENDDLAPFASEKKVALALHPPSFEKMAVALLLKNPAATELFFLVKNPGEVEERFQKYQHILESVALAKEIISAPANRMHPAAIAKRCEKLRELGIAVDVLDEKKLQEMGADALLAVGKGSPNTPKMVVMQWKGSQESPIALVGKGVCFDAGGINLKTSFLCEMKWDKAGAGVVIGVMHALAKMQAPINVVAVAVLAENMPDGCALKPGDVISSLAGKTIEIVDTDCEGRLALADGLTYVQKHFSPKIVLDLGTLTLETFGALGHEYAGLFSNNEALAHALMEAGAKTGEKLWPLPLGSYYARQVRSKIADLKNEGVCRYGASSAAAEFLRAFIVPEVSWAHIDISGTTWNHEAPENGVTGFGVQLLVEYLLKNHQ